MCTPVLIMALLMSPAILAVAGGLLLGHRKSMAKLRMAANPMDQLQLQGLAETARRLEQRIFYLENVLDTEAPGWRSRSDQR